MDIPFVYGRVATNKEFTGRANDIARLKANLTSKVNTTIISPRRWGKSSLVHKVLDEINAESNNFITCHIDVFNCRDEESFFKCYASSVLNASSTKMDELISTAKKYLGSFGPKVSLSDAGAMMDFSLGIDFKEQSYTMDEILDLPEKIAKEKGKQMIVCIDEFQNIENFKDPKALQARLRAHWQMHQNVCYCLYGSKRHMLLNIFSDYEMPLYKFGDIIALDKISEDEWVSFIVRRFTDTGKHISKEHARIIAERTECHSYYVQQYAQMVWLLTTSIVTDEILDTAFRQLVDRSSLLFDNLMDNLKTRQINFLLAIANEEKNLSSSDVLKKYNLGTSANIKNLKNAVIEHDLVCVDSGTLTIQDPILKFWIKERFREN